MSRIEFEPLLRAQAQALRAQAHALRVQADTIDAQASILEGGAALAPPAPEAAALLSKQQLASALAVSTATVDRLCRDGVVPFLIVGDSRRFDLVKVRSALEAHAAKEPSAPAVAAAPAPGGVRRVSRGGRPPRTP